MVLRRRSPHVANVVVGPRDPDALAHRNRLAFRRFRQPLSARHARRGRPARRAGRRWRAEVGVAELPPDRVSDPPEVRARMLAHCLDSGLPEDRIVALPPEHVVGQEVEVLVDAETSADEDLVQRDVVALVGIAGEKMFANSLSELT